MADFVPFQFEVESMDSELLRYLEEIVKTEDFEARIKNEIEVEYDGEIETQTELVEPMGIVPIAATLIIAFATAAAPAAGKAVGAAVGVAIGKILAEEIEEWYQEREEDKQEARMTIKGIAE